MTTYTIVPATLELIEAMEPHVRQADIEELRAAGGNTPGEAMREGLRMSMEAWIGLVDGEPICCFGVNAVSLLGRSGVPWMIGTDRIDRHAAGFLRRCRPVVQGWSESFDLLWNYVDARNTRAIRWLRWLGFEILPAQAYGLLGLPFHRFEMRSADHV